ncbi:MAG: hypothetical protein OER88_09620, partial [Planctomycetota bacterium]|nr:hypothetical protein [Planctomycetota bacterium]
MDAKTLCAGVVLGGVIGGLGVAVLSLDPGSSAPAPARSASLERRLGALGEDVAQLLRSVRALDAKVAVLRAPPAPGAASDPGVLHNVPARRVVPDQDLGRLAREPTNRPALA